MERQVSTCCRVEGADRRLCVYCGFAGLSIQAGGDLTAYRCPACQGDLYARPPRSYLEMEGFVALPDPGPIPVRGWRGLILSVLRLWNRLAFWRGSRTRPAVEIEPAPWDAADRRTARLHDRAGPGPRRRMTNSRDDTVN
jgi:hypothetical protein